MHMHAVTFDGGRRVWKQEVSVQRALILSWLPQTLASSPQELPPCGLIIEGEEVTGLPHSFLP